MSQERTENSAEMRLVDQTEPALGIITKDGSIDSTIRTVVRARNQDITVFVLNTTGNDEAAEILWGLGATLIDPIDAVDDGYRAALVEAAKNQDCPGIMIHERAGWVDFEASRDAFRQGSEYTVTAELEEVPEPPESPESGLLVGIPAYNEEIGVGSTVMGARQCADEVVVIDDGSEDRTAEIAREAGATVLEHETNQGKGRALNTFFSYARSTEHQEFVVLDGDGQHVPADIPAVLEPVQAGEADVVIGSRYLEKGAGSETPRYRRVGQKVLDVLTLGSSGTNLTDTQSGFRAFSPEAIDSLTLRTDGMGVETEMIGAAADSGLTIIEVPIDVRYEGVDGQTFDPFHHGVGVAAFTLQLIRDRHPLLFFGLPGVILVLAGTGLGLHSTVVYQNTGVFYGWRILIAGLTTIIGILGAFCGLILNRISNMITELTEGER